MPDTKISALTALAGADVVLATDVLPIVDTSATTTKKITAAELKIALVGSLGTMSLQDADSVDITNGSATFSNLTSGNAVISGGTIDGTPIGGTDPASASFLGLTVMAPVAEAVVSTFLEDGTSNGIELGVFTGQGFIQAFDRVNSVFFSYYFAADTIAFLTGGGNPASNTRMFIGSSGAVGIGTVTPASPLEVIGDVKATTFNGVVPFADGTYTVGIGVTDNGTITIQDGKITAIQEAT